MLHQHSRRLALVG